MEQTFSLVRKAVRRHAWSAWVFLPICFLAIAMLYVPGLDHPLVLDDRDSIERNPFITQWWPLNYSLQTPPGSPLDGRPLVNLSFAVNHAVSGMSPASFRLGNLAIHLANSVLAYLLLRLLVDKLPLPGRSRRAIAFWAVLIWAIHPLNVDAVHYITQRTELMASFFLLLTLWLTAVGRHIRRPASVRLAAVVACALGMLCKEIMFAAPLLVFLFDRAITEKSWSATFKTAPAFYLGLASTWAILAVMVFTQDRSGSVGYHHGVAAWQYFTLQTHVIVWYLVMLVWPSGFAIHHELIYPTQFQQWLPAFAFLSVLACISVYALWRYPRWGFAGACFFVILAPTSSFLPIVTETMAERRMYLPGLCVLGILMAGYFLLTYRCTTSEPVRKIARMAPVVVMILMLCVSWLRMKDFSSDETVYQGVLRLYPHSSKAHNNLAAYYLRIDQYDLAYVHIQLALEHQPGHERANLNLGRYFLAQNRIKEALAHYEMAVNIYYPDSADFWNDYASALISANRSADATIALEQALLYDPNWMIARVNLARLYAQLNRHEAAHLHADIALSNHPHHHLAPDLWELKGILGILESEYANAIYAFTKASQQDPGNPRREILLIRALLTAGKTAEARTRLQTLKAPNEYHEEIRSLWKRFGHTPAPDKTWD